MNGVLFPGGAPLDCYFNKGWQVYSEAIKMNDAGIYFPLLGICMGHELFAVYSSSKNWDVLSDKFSENVSVPVEFLVDDPITETQMFADATADQINLYSTYDWAFQNHQHGVDLSEFDDPELSAMFKPTSTATDPTHGDTFVNTMESERYPFFSMQNHPAKPAHTYYDYDGLNHSWESLQLNAFLGEFFVKKTRQSPNDPGSYEEVQAKIIENTT